MMADRVQTLTDLFAEAGRAHHRAFIETDGADDEWPIWYADYLMDKLAPLLGVKITKSELVYVLVLLSKEHPRLAPNEPWPGYYARYLMQQYA